MKYISVFFLIFVIAVIVLADNGNLPYSIRALYDFPNGDKIGHFILFGLFDFVLTCAILSSRPFKYPVRVTLSIGMILALLLPKNFSPPAPSTCWICWQVMQGYSLFLSGDFLE